MGCLVSESQKISQNKHGAGSPGERGEWRGVSSLWFFYEQEILKLLPRHTQSIEKNIVGFHIISLFEIDRDKVDNQQSCPLTYDNSTDADHNSFWLCLLVLTGRSDEPVPKHVKQVELQVPRTAGLQLVWHFSDFSPRRFLSLPVRLFGYRSQTSTSLWMLSVCLAEIEKHKSK